MDPSREAGNQDARLAVQRGSHGDGLCDARLYSCRGRYQQQRSRAILICETLLAITLEWRRDDKGRAGTTASHVSGVLASGAPGSQFGWADNRRTAANDFVRSSVDAFSKSCGANGNRLKTMMRLAAHQNRTRMSA